MQIDERDILKIRKNQDVFVSMDSYKGKIFNAKVSRILPMMNERSKTFIVEAVFSEKPEILYPNLTFEASILLQTKEKALLIPRNYLQNDSLVSLKNGSVISVKTGLKDYQKIEIVSGLNATDELIMPK
jgi:multidrug efflux pump subunit AcrA (membrane-fusion protein)